MSKTTKEKKRIPIYQIKYSYQTGNSFSSQDLEETMEYEWTNYDRVREAVDRMREHYKYYQGNNNPAYKKIKKPKWLKSTSEWDNQGFYSINLRLDDGKEFQYPPPWIGYFERLYGLEIITKNEKWEM
jgi:hypothetical protein